MHKAVGLLSGGLDSALSARVLKNQGIDVHAVFVSMPWGCGKAGRVRMICDKLGIPLKIIPLGDDYLEILRKPKHGFGSAFNPCIDCHIYMVRKAAEYMKEIGGEFVFTGEVLGQRPMSQHRRALDRVAECSGIAGRLLRPLSAQLLEPTIPEQEGIVERAKLPVIQGRSRKTQFQLAKELGLEGFASPGGGCLLTEKHFGERMKDIFSHDVPSIAFTAILGLGRYFRINDNLFVILGRDSKENDRLVETAIEGDVILRPFEFPGPLAVVRGVADDDMLRFVAGLIQFYSKHRDQAPSVVKCWTKGVAGQEREIAVKPLDEALAGQYLISSE